MANVTHMQHLNHDSTHTTVALMYTIAIHTMSFNIASDKHKPYTCTHQTHSFAWSACAYTPGSLSSIVMNAMLGETISTRPGWSVELITTLKYSDSSVVLSSMVDTIKVAFC